MTRKIVATGIWGALWVCFIGLQIALAQEDGAESNDSFQSIQQSDLDGFIRIRQDSEYEPLALQTSVTRYEGTNADGERVTVDLIGVVHVGEQDYYESLNEIFSRYQAVLYELVAPEGTRIPKGGRVDEGFNPIAALQKGMKAVLDLEFQLDHVDYTVENLVHADMTPEEFLESMKNNDESFAKMMFRAIGQSIAMQNSGGISNFDLLKTMLADDPAIEFRRLAAKQMRDLESGMIIFEGKDGSTIIHHRNRKAMKILQREIDDGKTDLAVFYGAGHLPDMDQHLVDDMKMRRGGRYWLDAWNLQSR